MEESRNQKGFYVWSTYNTKKVIQQVRQNEKYVKMPAEISAQMMREEKEGAQLIITAGCDLTYTLTAKALENEKGDVFPVENITIFHQKYVQIGALNNGNPEFMEGDWIPDMLMPMQTAVAYGENTVTEGNNQGITVEFHSAGVAPGVYSGNFDLNVNGEKVEIPVSLEVWDIAYEGRRTFQSSFLIFRDAFMVGEGEESDEMMDAYVDVLLDYKADSMIIPKGDISLEDFVRNCKRQFENKHCCSLSIFSWMRLDYKVYDSAGLVTAEAEKVVKYIKALAKESTEEHPYIEYAYLYPTEIDEAESFPEKIQPAWDFLRIGGEVDQTRELVVKQLREEGWFDTQTQEFAVRVERAIMDLPVILTSTAFRKDWMEGMHAVFCPCEGEKYGNPENLRMAQDSAKKLGGGKLWIYSCIGPLYPYATFHVDDQTLGMRVCGWMEKAYDITGYLYYLVNKYDGPKGEKIDVYTNPLRFAPAYGDGYLLYPGKPYGSDKPFASLRLASYRDGMNDYDMLCVYEKLLKEYAARNGIQDIDMKDYVSDLYDSLFKDMVYEKEDERIYQARRVLANRIIALKNGETPNKIK